MCIITCRLDPKVMITVELRKSKERPVIPLSFSSALYPALPCGMHTSYSARHSVHMGNLSYARCVHVLFFTGYSHSNVKRYASAQRQRQVGVLGVFD